LATTPAAASDQVPFRASFSTEVEIEFVYPFFYISVTGQGNASHMGATTAVTDNQVVNVIDGTATATYTLTGANGDTVVLDMIFQTTFLPDNAVSFEGSYTVTTGTGRFDGATGNGVLAGSAIVTGPNTGVGAFSVAGTISSQGS
jgi:predicted ATP-dependent serine protease